MRADTTPAGARDLVAIWFATRSRIIDLLQSVSAGIAALPVPTVPGASIHELLAHLVAVSTGAVDTDRWRGVLVLPPKADPRGTVDELVAAWDRAADDAHERIRSLPGLASVLITDAAMAEHDLRTALHLPGARDDIAVKVALDELSGRFSDRAAAAGLPPLRVTVEQWGTIIGTGRATSCVVADRFEFVRAMSGRRSAAEIRQWNWGVEPDPYLSVISEVPLPLSGIHEHDPRIPEHMREREFLL